MAVQRTNWLNAPGRDPWYAHALESALSGYKAGREPYKIKQEEEQRTLANRLAAAKANTEEQYGGLNQLSGSAKNALVLERLAEMMPEGRENSAWKQAKAAHDLSQRHEMSTTELNEWYTQHPEFRLDPLSKSFVAQKKAGKGQDLFGNELFETPEQAQEGAETFERKRYMDTTPVALQQQAVASAQLDESFSLIDPDKAFAFSGPKGKIELAKERYEALKNDKPSQKLLDYEAQQSYIHNAVEQIRTYYGSSISPGMTANLNYLLNPENWINHPDTAKEKYKAVVDAYHQERKVTQRAQKTGNPYGKNPIFNIENNPAEHQAKAQQHGLNPTPGTFTKENIMAAAKKKKWSEKTTQAVLKHYGHQ